MYFGSRPDHLGYRPVTGAIPLWIKQQPPYSRSGFHLKKATRVEAADETLTIKIGGDESSKKKKFNKKTNRIKSAKYTLLTFLPLNLLEQFRRIANFYFLAMCIISLLIDSPVLPITSLLPLAFVISVTATKQGYEDYMRHKTDNIVNRSPVTVIRNGKEMDVKSEQIMQGDLVQVSKDCDIPCDLIILKSADSHGKCYVTTANLDGETNLKILHIPRALPHLPMDKLHTLGTIECEKPTSDLYSFNGKIMLSPNLQRFVPLNSLSSTEFHNILPLTSENLLLRGSRLKNTEWVIGCAVYIGQNTKLALNSKITRNKVASSEKYVNKFLIFLLVILICLVTFCYLYKRYYEIFAVGEHSYLGPATDQITISQFLQDYLSFLMLFNYLIPISLYVTIEMHKFLGALFLEWDYQLYDDVTNQPCVANTSDLNDDLGQVNILFSDKTGTLTKNEMSLQKVSINGQKYIVNGTKLIEENNESIFDINKFQEHHLIFLQALALCHTVQVLRNPDDDEGIEHVQKVYDFYDIKEECRNNQTNQNEIENDEVDFIHVAKTGDLNTDNNPLLIKSATSISSDEIKLNSKDVRRRSPPAGRMPSVMSRELLKNKVHPLNELPSTESIERPVTYPSAFQHSPDSRSSNLSFYRSTSHVDIQNSSSTTQTHRRTQSYGAPSTFQRRQGVSTTNMRSIASSLSTKQGYAMPSYTRETLLTRTESLRRKEVIKNVVEKLDYQASSPDEKALVEACANLGIIYMGDEDDIISLQVLAPHLNTPSFNNNICNRKWNFKRLEVLEFSSERKRMSVIVKDKNSDIWIYTKGAESFVFPLCRRNSSELINVTNNHINDFAKEGLRTLAIARRRVTSEEFKEFRNELMVASSALNNRKELVEQCYEKMERNLELIGATAVEDALQDNVCDTFKALQEAGIKIWVLTGDKIETAYNIALSCGHIAGNFEKYFITECKSKVEVMEHLKALGHEMSALPNIKFALLIDGKSLTVALNECRDDFRNISVKCRAVLCCRLSPLQKCEVVHLIKQTRKYITAAIGDGANDVSMIQEAHIGLGIVGKEGRQAARCADYAFANFCMLKRILLVHGHYFSKRLSILVLYFFYKNVVFMSMEVIYQFDTMFSTTPIFDTLYLTLYNVLYTSVPILVLSLTEQPYNQATLLRRPELYLKNTSYKPLQWQYFIGWLTLAMYHAVIIYFISYGVWMYNNAILITSQPADLSCFGTFLVHNVVILVNLKLLIEAKHRTYLLIATIFGSIVAFVLTTLIYNAITILYDTTMYWTYINLLSSITFWILSVLTITTSLVPDIISLIPEDRARNLLQRRVKISSNSNRNVESTNL